MKINYVTAGVDLIWTRVSTAAGLDPRPLQEPGLVRTRSRAASRGNQLHSLKDRPGSARARDGASAPAAPPSTPPRSASARAVEERAFADHDGAFFGTPRELEAILEGRTPDYARRAPPRWRPGATLAFAVGVSLALWAGILLLLR